MLAGLTMLRASTNALIENPAGGSSVLVNQLQYQPLQALEGLGEMAELHAELVWDSLLTFAGKSVYSLVRLLTKHSNIYVTVDHKLLS